MERRFQSLDPSVRNFVIWAPETEIGWTFADNVQGYIKRDPYKLELPAISHRFRPLPKGQRLLPDPEIHARYEQNPDFRSGNPDPREAVRAF